MAQEYELTPVGDLRPDPANANQGDLEAIAQSVGRSGFYGAIIANRRTGLIIAGEHRWRAAQAAGLAEVPVIWVNVDAATARRIMVADNRTSRLGTDDPAKLIALLRTFDGDLEGTGYSAEDFARLLQGKVGPAGAQLTDVDDLPIGTPPPTAETGQVYLCGPHRVICGDSTQSAVVGAVVAPDGLVDAVWTDPPYGINYTGGSKPRGNSPRDKIEGDRDGKFHRILIGALDNVLAFTKPGAPVYVAAPGGAQGHVFAGELLERGLYRQRLVWVKDIMTIGYADWQYRHEDIYFGVAHEDIYYGRAPAPKGSGRLGRGGPRWFGGHSHTTVFEVPKPSRSDDHPTMKPVKLITEQLECATPPGAIVLDLFGGSGSTLIACHASGRVARLVELERHYVDVILRRWQDHTGEVPTLVDGTPVDMRRGDDDGSTRTQAAAPPPEGGEGRDTAEQGELPRAAGARRGRRRTP